MGSCCTKSPVEEEPPAVRKPVQVDEGLRARQARASKQAGFGTINPPPKPLNQNGTTTLHKHPPRSREQTPAQSHRRPKSIVENPVEQVNPKPEAKRPPAPQQPTERKKHTARVGSNIKDNKETIPLGKRTNFGYERNFKQKYTLGKLLGHGQFGYTYVAIEKATGERMAVKTIEKKQVTVPSCISVFFVCVALI